MSKRVISSLVMATGMVGAVVSTQAWAQAEDAATSNPLVQQCLQQGQAKDGKTFHSNLVASTNVKRYTPNKAFRLTVSLEGQGDAFYNLSCQVDASGNVTYKGYDASGMPLD